LQHLGGEFSSRGVQEYLMLTREKKRNQEELEEEEMSFH
jgi:hypothetical protein